MPDEQDSKNFGELLNETLDGHKIVPIKGPRLNPRKNKTVAAKTSRQTATATKQDKSAQDAPAPLAATTAKARPARASKMQRATAGTHLGSEDTPTYRMPGMSEKQFSKWRDAARKQRLREIDLHGMTRDEAIRATKNFMAELCQRGVDTGHIIHGKGTRSKDSKGVLKAAVRLEALRPNPQLKAYFTAANGGATVIWLKTK